MRIALAQINPLMGNIVANRDKIQDCLLWAQQHRAELVVFPEMALSAYPPLDLLKSRQFLKVIHQALQHIHQSLPEDLTVVLGSPQGLHFPPGNAAFVLKKHSQPQVFSKSILADYDVFDEARYFQKKELTDHVFSVQDCCIQLFICAEMWQWSRHRIPNHKVHMILGLNASPFSIGKDNIRQKMAQRFVKNFQCPVVYMNLVGGQEELIFDGGSFVLDSQGHLVHQLSWFREDLAIIDLSISHSIHKPPSVRTADLHNQQQKEGTRIASKIEQALVFGLKEFVNKHGFQRVHLGLSGGLDSALVCWLACRALGSQNVTALFLPGSFTSELSVRACQDMVSALGCSIQVMDTKNWYQQFMDTWSASYKNIPSVVMENVQARIRCCYLMAYANQHPQSLLLGTANKSELSMGYATLYGDLSGGLFPIGDLLKTEVFELARMLKNPAIPSVILDRPPTAELRANHIDEDDLPSYTKLDAALKKIVEQAQDPSNDFEQEIFQKILRSEFKRWQSPPILKLKTHAFDRGWRRPLFVDPSFLQRK